ncbi:uncharacterized protein [Primulina eburnea]|uniref:uncharacterized protein isoform X3 n=1 Tax=Primulina eburnea TaxID=1245227 RepID=UPI003C6C4576
MVLWVSRSTNSKRISPLSKQIKKSMEHHTTTSRTEAERLLGIAEKLLRNNDLSGCRDFAILAQETEPLLEGSEQILAVSEVLLASDKGVNNHIDWYSVLQVPPQRTHDFELIKKQYRRLCLLLHPDKNKLPFSDSAFRLVSDAWAVVSDPAKKAVYDGELTRFTKVDLVASRKQQSFQQQKKPQQPKGDNSHQKLPVRRNTKGGSGGGVGGSGATKVNKKNTTGTPTAKLPPSFWTACPYCYNLYEYPRAYEGCCLRCDSENCKKAFTATEILSLPPTVPGQEAYYCCWGFFPMGFVAGIVESPQKWMPPPVFEDEGPPDAGEVGGPEPPPPQPPPPPPDNIPAPIPVSAVGSSVSTDGKRKRGRPRKLGSQPRIENKPRG